MRPLLKTLITDDELRVRISEGKTLAQISSEIHWKTGFQFSTAAVSKRCKAIGLKLPRSGPRSGAGHKGWKGGVILNKSGYLETYAPDHPHRKKHTPYVLSHRLVMESHLGRYLLPTEIVHHKNGDRTDNRIENLEVFQSNAEHLRVTLLGKTPRWTEEGKERIRAATRKKNGTNYIYSPEEILRRRARVRLASTIQRELKLGGLPSRQTIDHYLAQHGTDYQQAFEKELTLLQQPAS